MPELPEVEITKLQLAPIVGKRINALESDLPAKIFSSLAFGQINHDITGRIISSLSRTGKILFLHLGHSSRPEKLLAFHFRMSGRLHFMTATASYAKHTHGVIYFADQTSLRSKNPT